MVGRRGGECAGLRCLNLRLLTCTELSEEGRSNLVFLYRLPHSVCVVLVPRSAR